MPPAARPQAAMTEHDETLGTGELARKYMALRRSVNAVSQREDETIALHGEVGRIGSGLR